MSEKENWVASGATQEFLSLCQEWDEYRADSWDSLPQTDADVFRHLFENQLPEKNFAFGNYFCHYLVYRFAAWFEPLMQTLNIPGGSGWKEQMACTLFDNVDTPQGKVLCKAIVGFPGFPDKLLVDGQKKYEGMATALKHLIRCGTAADKVKPGAALNRFMGFALAVRMNVSDAELFLKKALRTAGFDYKDEKQLCCYLSLKFAQRDCTEFYLELLDAYRQAEAKIYDETILANAILPARKENAKDRMPDHASQNQGKVMHMDTRSLGKSLERITGNLREYSVEHASQLTPILSNQKGIMRRYLQQDVFQVVSARARKASALMRDIEESFRELVAPVEQENAQIRVTYRRDKGLHIPAGTVLRAQLLWKNSRTTENENATESVDFTVLKACRILPESCAEEAVADVEILCDPKYYASDYWACAWSWQPGAVSGIARIETGSKWLYRVPGLALSDYLYHSEFSDRTLPSTFPQDISRLLEGTELSPSRISKLKDPAKYAADVSIERKDILTLAAIYVMLVLQLEGEPTEEDLLNVEKAELPAGLSALEEEAWERDGQRRVEENRDMFIMYVNNALNGCGFYPLYLADAYDRLLASLMACESPIDFYRFLWYCKKHAGEAD